jgi:hypothetical protein
MVLVLLLHVHCACQNSKCEKLKKLDLANHQGVKPKIKKLNTTSMGEYIAKRSWWRNGRCVIAGSFVFQLE